MDPLGCVRWQDLLHPSQWTWLLRCIATFVVSFLRTAYNVRDQDLSSKAKRLLHMCDSQNMGLFPIGIGHQCINSDFYTHCEDSNCGIDDYKPYINHTPCSSTMAHIYTHPDKKNAWDKCLWKVTDIVILLRCMHPSHLQSSVFFFGGGLLLIFNLWYPCLVVTSRFSRINQRSLRSWRFSISTADRTKNKFCHIKSQNVCEGWQMNKVGIRM